MPSPIRVQISAKAFALMPPTFGRRYRNAYAKFKKKKWGQGHSMIATDLTFAELKELSAQVEPALLATDKDGYSILNSAKRWHLTKALEVLRLAERGASL